ncbi:transposase [Xenorhabdus sp. Vera]|uniref:IS66 family insertion sequence element accessory protein TnpA n=1 Tax=Xenorhabdus koppenhoeferi TaxID=351659 RepID=UPI0019A30557|nr:transposase [Xenorhabdus sp. Vera]MBD2812456.1 transposase [Xenorhabdus sp. Vera]
MSQSRFTQAEWRDIFEQQKKSPLTVRQFCQKIGISTNRFYHHRQLGSRPPEKPAEPAAPPALIKISTAQENTAPSGTPPVLFETPHGTLRFPAGTETHVIIAIIRGLAA